MKDFKNKVVCISGVGSGMGKEMAIAFSKSQAKLAINDINEANLEETASICRSNNSELLSMVFDVAKQDKWNDFRTAVLDKYNTVDLVINNAGVALGNYTVRELEIKDFEWIMGINFWGMIYGSKVFLEDLIKQPEAAIVNFSSVFGLAGVSRNSAYCATKFGIRGFTESLRMEAMAHYPHVAIQSVHPGGIDTNITKDSRWNPVYSEAEKKEQQEIFETNFITTAAEAATVVIEGIRKKKPRILIGSDARKLDRTVRLFPSKYTKLFIDSLRKEGKEI